MRVEDILFTPIEGFEFEDERLNDPFDYLPHSAVVAAADIVNRELNDVARCNNDLREELVRGKMLGVLVVRNERGEVGFLRAFSGAIAGCNHLDGFVPPIYDIDVDGGYFRAEEAVISGVNQQIEQLKNSEEHKNIIGSYELARLDVEQKIAAARAEYRASKGERTPQQSQQQKGELRRFEASLKWQLVELKEQAEREKSRIEELCAERIERSNALQRRVFESYRVVNGEGEWRSIYSIFDERYQRLPPAGTGDCAAPKMLHYALTHNYHPLAVGEFWRGESPKGEVREEGHFYGACQGKCMPILTFMLQGVDVAPVAEELSRVKEVKEELTIIFEDSDIIVFNKPSGMLSVRGRIKAASVESYINEHYSGAMMPHRLDQDTSGVLVVAKSREVHHSLQRQFSERAITKRYIATVEGYIEQESGEIELPMRPNPLDRPRQMVDHQQGKSAVTHFEVLERQQTPPRTRLALYPHTGRTHQLRLHCAHREGLNAPIVGDRLYGSGVESAPRLALNAESITFRHPTSGEVVTFSCQI